MVRASEVFTAEDRRLIAQWRRAERAIEHLAGTRPSLLFEPHEAGQLQALCSDHTYRILIPGNGWGKTTLMALDVDLLMQRDDPFKPQCMPKPDRPTTAIWITQKYQQFEVMKPDLEVMFTRGWKWNSQKHSYEWPNGSRLFILSSDSDWTSIQGVEIDAVYFDEHPDRKLWNEMQFRRRGKKKTRFTVAATMTLGLTWFVKDVIVAWEHWCRDQGLTNARALELQPHATTFVWNIGGIEDNPSMTEEDAEHYASIRTLSDKEREVRMRGGYADFTGEGVFHLPALLAMEKRAQEGESGAIVFLPDEDQTLADKLFYDAEGNPAGHRFAGRMDQSLFRWRPGMELEAGRITIFEPPDPELIGNYIIGADFAAGLVGKDYDAAVVGVKTADGKVRQVAEAHGHWGDIFFAEVLYSLGVLYFEAFIVGERQFGLPCLRRLYDEMGYTYMYYQRREDTRARRFSDLLGHHRGQGDTIIPLHRLAIRRGDLELVSPDAIREHKRYQFRPRKKDDTIDDVERSSDLITSAPSGENDDLVMGSAYLMHGAREIVHYPRPKRVYKPGSFGDVMKLDETLNPRKKYRDPYAR